MLLKIIFCKLLSFFPRILNLGAGGTWPGHLMLFFNPSFLEVYLNQLTEGFIVVAGTNGKTTTTALIVHTLRQKGKKVVSNSSGANLLNGIASALLADLSWRGKLCSQIGVFEIDENFLPSLVLAGEPRQIIILNLFRDQLDRYGEIDSIIQRWEKVFLKLENTHLLLNADDPAVANLGKKTRLPRSYFGLGLPKSLSSSHHHVLDSLFCQCGSKLKFVKRYFSHLGVWFCPSCGSRAPSLDQKAELSLTNLPGYFNQYNYTACLLSLSLMGFPSVSSINTLASFLPVFGRFEEIIWHQRRFRLCLAKNPTGLNESLRTVLEERSAQVPLIIALNDRIPDGRDISWIWDVDFETLLTNQLQVYVTGDRAYDLALRIQYSGKELGKDLHVFPVYQKMFQSLLLTEVTNYSWPILATYSAMLEIRRFLSGKFFR